MSRPSKLTESTMQKLCDAIALGATYTLAAKFAGISYATLKVWRAQAEQARPGTKARQLLERLDDAEGRAAVRWLGQIEQAAREGAWQASAWRLERRYPQEYGRQVIQHDGHLDVTTQPEWQTLRTSIMSALAPFPEARILLAGVLSGELGSVGDHRNGSTNGTHP